MRIPILGAPLVLYRRHHRFLDHFGKPSKCVLQVGRPRTGATSVGGTIRAHLGTVQHSGAIGTFDVKT